MLEMRSRGVDIRWPMEAIMKGSHVMGVADAGVADSGACPACGPEAAKRHIRAGAVRCLRCGACADSAAWHICPRVDVEHLWRAVPGRTYRAEALGALRQLTRQDGCSFGCKHKSTACFDPGGEVEGRASSTRGEATGGQEDVMDRATARGLWAPILQGWRGWEGKFGHNYAADGGQQH